MCDVRAQSQLAAYTSRKTRWDKINQETFAKEESVNVAEANALAPSTPQVVEQVVDTEIIFN
jgi:hypothetical protein